MQTTTISIPISCSVRASSMCIYRIVPNRRAVREWEGLGARLLIYQKWDECGHSLDQLLN